MVPLCCYLVSLLHHASTLEIFHLITVKKPCWLPSFTYFQYFWTGFTFFKDQAGPVGIQSEFKREKLIPEKQKLRERKLFV